MHFQRHAGVGACVRASRGDVLAESKGAFLSRAEERAARERGEKRSVGSRVPGAWFGKAMRVFMGMGGWVGDRRREEGKKERKKEGIICGTMALFVANPFRSHDS